MGEPSKKKRTKESIKNNNKPEDNKLDEDIEKNLVKIFQKMINRRKK